MRQHKRTKKNLSVSDNLLILGGTYVLALAILEFGSMNPYVVALMPCLALTLTILTRK